MHLLRFKDPADLEEEKRLRIFKLKENLRDPFEISHVPTRLLAIYVALLHEVSKNSAAVKLGIATKFRLVYWTTGPAQFCATFSITSPNTVNFIRTHNHLARI
jgi:hypothetical protein